VRVGTGVPGRGATAAASSVSPASLGVLAGLMEEGAGYGFYAALPVAGFMASPTLVVSANCSKRTICPRRTIPG